MSRLGPGEEVPRRPKVGRGHQKATKQAQAKERAQNAKAIQRQSLRSFLQHLGDVKLRVAMDRIAQAIGRRELDIPMPSRSTVHRVMQKIRVDEVPVPPFPRLRDAPRSGRPRKELDERIAEAARNALLTGKAKSVAAMHRVACKAAAKHRLPGPSVYQIRKLRDEMDPAAITAGLFGSRSAVTDAMVVGGVPADAVHHVWTFDEMAIPVWVRIWDKDAESWRSAQTDLIVVMDNASRVVVGWHVVDQRSISHPQKATALDVLGTLVGCAIRPLAPASSRPFAGALPQTLRYDRLPAHLRFERTAGEHLKLGHVELPTLPVYHPGARGNVERLVQVFKQRSVEIPGSAERYLPVDRMTTSQRQVRSRQAGSLTRGRRRAEVSVEDLLTIDELRVHIDALVDDYHDCEHSELAMTPRVAFKRGAPDAQPLDGSLILEAMPKVVRSVTREGVTWGGRVFMPLEGQAILPVGTEVTFRPDPLGRALLVERLASRRVDLVFPPKDTWIRSIDPGVFAKERRQMAKEYSDEAAELYAQMADQDFGAGAGAGVRSNRTKFDGPSIEDEQTSGRAAEGRGSRAEEPEDGVISLTKAQGARSQGRPAKGKTPPVGPTDPKQQLRLIKGGG